MNWRTHKAPLAVHYYVTFSLCDIPFYFPCTLQIAVFWSALQSSICTIICNNCIIMNQQHLKYLLTAVLLFFLSNTIVFVLIITFPMPRHIDQIDNEWKRKVRDRRKQILKTHEFLKIVHFIVVGSRIWQIL